MKTVKKPTIEELINGFDYIYNPNTLELDAEEATDISIKNLLALQNVTHEDYDVNNFHKLIQSIEANGLTNFNMTTFIANIEDIVLTDIESTPINNLTLFSSAVACDNAFDVITSSFNCDSVGCIAGFATANALNWQQPKWMKSDSREYLKFLENIACNYLNIPLEVGRRIFYGDNGSLWSFLRFNEPSDYESLKWENSTRRLNRYNCDYDDQWECESIELSSINYKVAVEALHRIMDGQIIFAKDNEYLPEYVTNYNSRKKKDSYDN